MLALDDDWWRVLDSNQRRHKPAGLQPAPIGHSGNPPKNFSNPFVADPTQPARRALVQDSIRAGEGTRTPNRLLTKQVLYRLSYTSETSLAAWQPLARRSVVQQKWSANFLLFCDCLQVEPSSRAALLCRGPANCDLRPAFALPAGKNHARREIDRRDAIDAR